MRSSRSTSVAGPSAASASAPAPPPLIKIALLGDANVGKTSLMVRYVENEYDETQLPTQGVNFMERTVRLQQHEVTFSIWDIGGGKDNESMLPLVCNDAAALLFMFDLARLETLDSIREWHKKARGLNKVAVPFLIGAKYDTLADQPPEEQERAYGMARAFAAAINAPLVFCAPSVPVNVANVFKVVLIRLFGLQPAVPRLQSPGEPLVVYETEREREARERGLRASPTARPEESGSGPQSSGHPERNFSVHTASSAGTFAV